MEKRINVQKSLLQVLSTSLTLLIGDYLMDSVHFERPWVAILTAMVLGVLNIFLKPLLVMLTIPATVLTLGLFLMVINAALLMIADQIVPGFSIASFGSAFLLALLISIVNGLLGGSVRVEKHKIDPE